MMYRGIVWDLDGTLLDTLEDLTAATNYALTVHGYPPRTEAEMRRFVGNGAVMQITRAVPAGTGEAERDAVLSTYRAYYAAHANDATKPYPWIPALLTELSAAGMRMAIVSNKPDFAVQTLAESYFGKWVKTAVGARDGVPIKPAPDAVFTAIKEMGLTLSECVYIGDSEVDVATAAAAKMDCLTVTWGFRTVAELTAAGARRFCPDADAVRRALGI